MIAGASISLNGKDTSPNMIRIQKLPYVFSALGYFLTFPNGNDGREMKPVFHSVNPLNLPKNTQNLSDFFLHHSSRNVLLSRISTHLRTCRKDAFHAYRPLLEKRFPAATSRQVLAELYSRRNTLCESRTRMPRSDEGVRQVQQLLAKKNRAIRRSRYLYQHGPFYFYIFVKIVRSQLHRRSFKHPAHRKTICTLHRLVQRQYMTT